MAAGAGVVSISSGAGSSQFQESMQSHEQVLARPARNNIEKSSDHSGLGNTTLWCMDLIPHRCTVLCVHGV